MVGKILEKGRCGRPLAWTAVAFLAAAMPYPAGAGASPAFVAQSPAPHPLLVEAAAVNKCTHILPTGGREVIINSCGSCRVVSILRKRPGNAVPISRTYNVQGLSTIPVPFRGPGRSRITSELPCKGEKGAARNLVDPSPRKKNSKACVSLVKAASGSIVLSNTCKACRAVLIERLGGASGKGERQAYKVAPRSMMSVPSKGAKQVALIGEINCP